MSNIKNNKGGRSLTVKVKTAKRRKISSSKWLARQLNDPYVQEAKKEGYRSRAAFKLKEINEKFNIIKPSSVVIDIGAAPGGWTQIALETIKESKGGKVIAIDISPMEEINRAIIITHDFLAPEIADIIKIHLHSKADLVMSDMAASSCGHAPTDHLKIIALCEAAFEFAKDNLAEGGSFVAKILKGGTENTLLTEIKQKFRQVKHFKPPSSRSDSAESYIVATGFHS
ncbi:MAG: RlmE family RNA methyltransferase [Alphaproteobacteria bacterium]